MQTQNTHIGTIITMMHLNPSYTVWSLLWAAILFCALLLTATRRWWRSLGLTLFLAGFFIAILSLNTVATAQLASDGYTIQPASYYAQPTTTTQNPSSSATRFHKQIEWKRIKAFLNEASQEGLNPTTANETAVSNTTTPPTGWTSIQLKQLGRYEATVYGKVYLLQLHGPDTPDKRLYRLEQTLQLSPNRSRDTQKKEPLLTETRLMALKAKMDGMGIALSDGDQQKVSDWAIALMEARVFQGTAPDQSTEQRVQALEVAVFGIPSTDLSPVSLTTNAPVPTPEPSLAKRVAVLGEQFPVRLSGLQERMPRAGQAAPLATTPAQAEEVLDEVEFIADTVPAAAAKPNVIPPKKEPTPQALLAIANTPKPTQPFHEVWFKPTPQATPMREATPPPPATPIKAAPPLKLPILAAVADPILPPLPQSTQSVWNDAKAVEPLHVFVAAASPEELHAVLMAVESAAALQPLQVVRYSQLADVWVTGSVGTPLPPGLSPHRVLRLQRDCAVSTRAAVPWGTCMQQWLSAHKP